MEGIKYVADNMPNYMQENTTALVMETCFKPPNVFIISCDFNPVMPVNELILKFAVRECLK